MDLDPEDCWILSNWLAGKLSSHFSKWSHQELVSEIYVLYQERIGRWNPDRGSLGSFGLGTFKSPLMTRYLSDQGIRVFRRRGQPRQYIHSYPITDLCEYEDDGPWDFPWKLLTTDEVGLVQMRANGTSIKQISVSQDVPTSTMADRFRRLKQKLSWVYATSRRNKLQSE